jgi:hypothetical protein
VPETQYEERTALARERSSLALLVIAALLVSHSRIPLAVATGLLVAAVGLRARSPRAIAGATALAALCAAVVVVI